jgi:hypothetical protein
MPLQLQARREKEWCIFLRDVCTYQPTVRNSYDIQEITAFHKLRKYLQRMVSSAYPKPN